MQPAILLSPHFYTARDQFRKPPFGEDVMLCSAAGPVCSAYSQILLQCVACHFTLAIGCCCGKTAQLMSDKECTGCSCSCGTCCTCRHVQLSDSHVNTNDFVLFRPKDNCKKRSETTNAQRPKKNRHADCLSRVKAIRLIQSTLSAYALDAATYAFFLRKLCSRLRSRLPFA